MYFCQLPSEPHLCLKTAWPTASPIHWDSGFQQVGSHPLPLLICRAMFQSTPRKVTTFRHL